MKCCGMVIPHRSKFCTECRLGRLSSAAYAGQGAEPAQTAPIQVALHVRAPSAYGASQVSQPLMVLMDKPMTCAHILSHVSG